MSSFPSIGQPMAGRQGLGASSAGSSAEHAMVVGAVGLLGALGLSAFGGAAGNAIDGGASGGVLVSVQAGSSEPVEVTPTYDEQPVNIVTASAPPPSGTAGMSPEEIEAFELYVAEQPAGGGGGGLNLGDLGRRVGNVLDNVGANPINWVTDPIGEVGRTWDLAWGLGEFGVSTVTGLLQLSFTINDVVGPINMAHELLTDGPRSFIGRRLGIFEEARRLAPGAAQLAWELSPGGAVDPNPFGVFGDRERALDTIAENPIVQQVLAPFIECSDGTDAANVNACGEVAGDAIFSIITGGGSHAASGLDDVADAARVMDDAVRVSDEAARRADEIAARSAESADELAEARRSIGWSEADEPWTLVDDATYARQLDDLSGEGADWVRQQLDDGFGTRTHSDPESVTPVLGAPSGVISETNARFLFESLYRNQMGMGIQMLMDDFRDLLRFRSVSSERWASQVENAFARHHRVQPQFLDSHPALDPAEGILSARVGDDILIHESLLDPANIEALLQELTRQHTPLALSLQLGADNIPLVRLADGSLRPLNEVFDDLIDGGRVAPQGSPASRAARD